LTEITRICFVCLGNIVRSPLAEGLFRKLVEEAGVNHKYQIESAGTSDWHIGESPDKRMERVAASHGLNYSNLARQYQPEDFERFDLIVAMDNTNRQDLMEMLPGEKSSKKIYLLREFDPFSEPNESVPDPYYGDMESFEQVYQIVERSCNGLFQALEDGYRIDS
jgi:protein-tyrosine phosphatase